MTTAPSHIAQHLPQVRTTRCACGEADVKQRLLSGEWLPDKCTLCIERRDGKRAALDAMAIENGSYTPPVFESEKHDRLAELNIPPQYENATLDNLRGYGTPFDRQRVEKLRRQAREWLAQYGKDPRKCTQFLILRGRTGSAKGHITWAMAKVLVTEHGARVLRTQLHDMVGRIRAAWADSGDAEARVLSDLRSYDVLIIDEASSHAVFGIDNMRRHLYQVIDHRILWLKPTILTTNESLGELEEKVLGPALTSRAHDDGKVWECGEESSTDFRVWRAGQRERKDLE